MSPTVDPTPFYKKLAFNLLSLSLMGAILYVGQSILIPLFFSMLLATLLLPLVMFMEKRKINRVVAILLSLLLSIITLLGVIYFLSSQMANFFQDFDIIKERLTEVFNSAQQWVGEQFNIAIRKQEELIEDTKEKVEAGKIVGQTFISITSFLSYIVLIPVYTFLLLYYKDLIKQFFIHIFRNDNEEQIREVLHESRLVSQSFITGLLIDVVIVFALNSTGFLILGIKYALFLALTAALLNLVPYIGMIAANIFCMLITLVSSENISDVLWVGLVLALVQLVDNNFLMPFIVGSKVRINAMATLIGVLVGGALCGIPGMFLAIPGIAVLKVIFDRVDGLRPYGILVGDNVDTPTLSFRRLRMKK
ncbi:MAG TPA: AI-2E family transporter [Cyclobacteriaceae bacterium]|nr:AI-2E family transporter [Cyclobacteriaceae bacterium]